MYGLMMDKGEHSLPYQGPSRADASTHVREGIKPVSATQLVSPTSCSFLSYSFFWCLRKGPGMHFSLHYKCLFVLGWHFLSWVFGKANTGLLPNGHIDLQ